MGTDEHRPQMAHIIRGRSGARRWAEVCPPPILLGLLAAVACSLSWMQWWRPVIEHDDWRQILTSQWFPSLMHTTQLSADGRWLTYGAWLAGEPHLSERAVVLLFAAAWLLFTAVFVRAVTTTWWAVPLAVAVYTTPMTADVGYWPATLFPAMTAVAMGATLLWLTRHRLGWHLLVLLGTICLAMLSYPPFALMVAVLVVAIHHRERWQRLVTLAAGFVGSYLAAVLLMFALNDLRFGVFGLKIANWRHPTPLNGIGSLAHHLHVGASDWKLVVEAILVPLAIGLVALIGALADRQVRRSVVVLMVAFGMCFVLDLAPTLLHGVSNPFRSMSWAWLCLVLMVSWTGMSVQPIIRSVGRVALVAIAIWGALYVADGVVGHERFQSAIGRLENEAVALAKLTGGRIVLTPRIGPWDRESGNTAEQFRGAIAKGSPPMASVLCDRHCRSRVLHYVRQHRVRSAVFYVRGWVVVRLPFGLYLTQLDVLPKPDWLEPWPWPANVRQ